MHGEEIPFGYGFWSLVVVNAAIFVLFALSFLAPVRRREWRSFGVFTAFVVALFTEMYGFPHPTEWGSSPSTAASAAARFTWP